MNGLTVKISEGNYDDCGNYKIDDSSEIHFSIISLIHGTFHDYSARARYSSNLKMRFQSFFMLMITHPFFLASSMSA